MSGRRGAHPQVAVLPSDERIGDVGCLIHDAGVRDGQRARGVDGCRCDRGGTGGRSFILLRPDLLSGLLVAIAR